MSAIDDLPEVPEYTENNDRRDVLEDLERAMDEALRKFTNGRIRKPENEKVRIQWLRAYTYAAATHRQIVNDVEDAEHEQRIARLEQALDLVDADGDDAK